MSIATMMMGLSGTAMMLHESALARVLSRAAVNGRREMPVPQAMGDPEDPSYPEEKREFLLEYVGVPVERRKDAAGNGVAVVRVVGPIMSDAVWAYWMGGVWSESLAMTLRALAKEQDVSPVVVVWDCPGGTVAGLTEIQAAFAELTAVRSVHSLAKECMCSLAYGIGCAADSIGATPTADVGSIGTRITLTSIVRMLDEEGIDVKNLTTGRLKLFGDQSEPITEDVVVYFQKNIDEHSREFFARVAGYRGLSVEDVAGLEGGFFDGKKAKELGLVDEVVLDPEAWINSKAGPVRPGASTAGGRPGRRALSASATGVDAMAMTFEEVEAKFGTQLAELKSAAMAAGKVEGKAEGLKEARAAASLADLQAKFPGEANAAFVLGCASSGVTMADAVERDNARKALEIDGLKKANAEQAARLASLGGAGKSLEASAEALKLKGGGGNGVASEDGLSDGVRAFKGAVEASVAAGNPLAVAISGATKAHGAHYMDWVKAGQPGAVKAK